MVKKYTKAELKKELEKQRTNIIRELKKNHPKGFCYICGKGKRTTIHHLRDYKDRRKGKVNGAIPLCRDCHDIIEDMKTTGKKTYHIGFNEGQRKNNLRCKRVVGTFKGEEFTDPEIWKDMKKELLKKLEDKSV